MIKWDDKYSTSISLIDKQHKTLFEIISKTIIVEKFSNDPKDILAVLDKMTGFALKHFETEEHYMKEFGFSGYNTHRNEHIDFTNTIIQYKNRVIGGEYKITCEILEYLKQWIVNHIEVTDREYIACFKKNGLK